MESVTTENQHIVMSARRHARQFNKMKRRLGTLPFLITSLLFVACSNDPKLALGEEKSTSDEPEITDKMIEAIKTISLNDAEDGLVKRVNQGKSLACLKGDFTVSEGLPEKLKQGIFATTTTYPAMVRFANASSDDDSKKDFRGMSIKLNGVEGSSLWGKDGELDFTLNSYPALFAANPDEFLSFLEANASGGIWKFFINPLNWDSAALLITGRAEISSPFDIRYWSTTPYRFGPDQSVAVKYSVKPCSTAKSDTPDNDHEDFFQDTMAAHLDSANVCFDFMVQFQIDPITMPIENASVEWDEEESPFLTVATLVISNQDFQEKETMLACEKATFNPWQTLAEHKPIGGINRVRRAVYSESGEFRNQQNQEK
ncbi:catalase family protein [Aurantivibrio infirmus]